MKPTGYTERDFPIHTQDSAPEGSKEILDWYQSNFGMVPHLAGVMAESPAALKSYWETQNALSSLGALSSQEMNVVQITIARESECQYCVAGHTAFGKTEFFNNTDEQLEAARSGGDYEDSRLNALRDFTLRVYEHKGRMANAHLQAFLDAGYTRAQALEVVANIAAKVMSNFVNQIAMTPVDEPMAPLADDLPFKEERGIKAA